MALDASPAYAQAKQTVILSQLALKDIKASYIPSIDANAGYTYQKTKTSPETPATTVDAFSFGGSVNMLIYDFGKTRSAARSAALKLRASEEDLRTQKSLIHYGLRHAVLEFLRAKDLSRVSTEEVKIFHCLLREMEERYDVGVVSQYAVTKSKADYSESLLRAVTASNGVLLAKVALNKALSLKNAPHFSVSEEGLETYEGMNISALMALASTNSPSLASLNAQKESASAYVDYTIASLYPSLGLSIQYNATENSGLLWNLVGAGQLTQSLLSQGKKMRAIDSAVANLRIARSRVAMEELDLSSKLTTAVLSSVKAMQELDVAKANLQNAEENLTVVRERFNVGKVSELDRSQAELALSKAKTNIANAKYNYLESQIAISQLIGR